MMVRKAVPQDADRIACLLAQLDYPATAEFAARKIAHMDRHPDAELVGADSGDGAVGFISIHYIPQVALEGAFARISYLCVDQAARGTGVGRMLEEYCVTAAARRGCDRIELHSHSRRAGAHAFYEALGYEESPKYFIKKL